MIDRLNLASQPFQNRTLPWVVTGVVACVSLIALVWIVSAARAANRQASETQAEVRALGERTRVIEERNLALKEELPPRERQLHDAAHLLVDRKRFSWSRLFADLETAMPTDVRVTRISVRDIVQTNRGTNADLTLAVTGRTPAAVTGMIAEMNRGGVFAVTPLSERAPKTEIGATSSEIEWTLQVKYTPSAGQPLNTSSEAIAEAAPNRIVEPSEPVDRNKSVEEER